MQVYLWEFTDIELLMITTFQYLSQSCNYQTTNSYEFLKKGTMKEASTTKLGTKSVVLTSLVDCTATEKEVQYINEVIFI